MNNMKTTPKKADSISRRFKKDKWPRENTRACVCNLARHWNFRNSVGTVIISNVTVSTLFSRGDCFSPGTTPE